MTKQVTHIECCPLEWESVNDWDSHRPLLYLALENTNDSVVEFGCGYGSTNLLQKWCTSFFRDGYSFDNDKEWAGKFNTRFIPNYEMIKLEGGTIGLLFIDGKPGEQRKVLIEKYKGIATVILIHDSEIGAEYVYGLSPILSTFKYRLDYQPEGKPHTTAVSNFVNVCEWV